MPSLRSLAVLMAGMLAAAPAHAQGRCTGRGCAGGPGYRAPSGRCASWSDLAKVCGSPPTTRCTAETVNAARLERDEMPKQRTSPRAAARAIR